MKVTLTAGDSLQALLARAETVSSRLGTSTCTIDVEGALAAFVEQMTRINRGRAFFATSDRLGEYVLVDFVRAKRRAVS